MAIEKLLPQNVDAEVNFLGCVLEDADRGDVVARWASRLALGDFYRERHRLIWQAMSDLYAARQSVDVVTVCDELERRGQLEDVGGQSGVSSLTNGVMTIYSADAYAAIIQRTATNRRLIHAAGQIAAVAYNDPEADDSVLEAQRLLFEAVQGWGGTNDSTPFGDVLDEFLIECRDAYEATRQGRRSGLPTGFSELDEILSGFHGGQLIYQAGRPGSGKSAFAGTMVQAAADACLRDGAGCVEWITLEMRATDQAKRVVSSFAGIDGRIIRRGFRTPEGNADYTAFKRVEAAVKTLRERYATVIRTLDKPMTFAQARAHITRSVMQRGCRLAVIDYLGLLEPEDAKATDYKRISDTSRHLKQLALELKIPILCLVQLNRQTEQRVNRRPQLADLRDSGGLEQDADVVLGLYRGAYYDQDRAEENKAFAQFAELWVLKARDSIANIMVPAKFEGEFTRASDWPAGVPLPADSTRDGTAKAKSGQQQDGETPRKTYPDDTEDEA